MTALVYIFFLFSTPPTDQFICALWVSKPPASAQMIEACGVESFTNIELVWRAVDIYTGEIVCERPATELPMIGCNLVPLDHYRLVVIWPMHQRLLCTPAIRHPGNPTSAEIDEKCPGLTEPYELRLDRVYEAATITPAPVPCQMPELDSTTGTVQDLATSQTYELLAAQLRWNYGPGVDPLAWQNQWDLEIFRVGQVYRVPPDVLKSLFGVEAQYWPLYNGPEEIGIGQLTDDGADIVLRYSPSLFSYNCSISGVSCQSYALLPEDHRQRVRDVLLRSLRTSGTPRQAAEQVRGQMGTWAQILVSYYCFAGEILSGWGDRPASLRWDMTLAVYHAGGECIRTGEICPAGQEYLMRIKR
jgi:hypothetical protein